MPVAIINNRIDGLRITIYDIVHYLEAGRTPEEIVTILPILSLEQVRAAIDYIEQHNEEVMAVHRQIEERIARGNPPEIEAKRQASRVKMLAWLRDRQQARNQESDGEGTAGRR